MFRPAPLVPIAHHLGAVGQVNGQRRFAGMGRPLVDADRLRHQIHGAARIEAASQGGAGVEAIVLMEKGACAAARIDVSFQHRHIQPGPGEQRSGRQPAYTCTDDDDPFSCAHAAP